MIKSTSVEELGGSGKKSDTIRIPPANSSSSSSSSASTSTTVTFSNKRTNSDVDRKTLEGHGITHKEMQKTFLSLRAKNRKARVALSCVKIPEQQPVQHKCEDIINAIVAMQSNNVIEILLPVQLMLRHGMSDISEEKRIPLMEERLRTWAIALGLPDDTLLPLITSPDMSIKKGDLTFNFKSWAGDYLPDSLKFRMDKLTTLMTEIISEDYSPETQKPLFGSLIKPSINKALTDSLKDAGVVNIPPNDLQEEICNGIIFHALLSIAHRHTQLESFTKMFNSKLLDLGDIATQMFTILRQNRAVSDVGQEFAHGITYAMEEICSPEIIKQLASENDVMIYIPVSQQVRRNNPLRLLAGWLKHEKSIVNIEPCNNYETPETREAKSIKEKLDTQSRTTPPPDTQDDDADDFFKVMTATITSAFNNNMLIDKKGKVCTRRVDTIVAGFASALTPDVIPTDGRSIRNSSSNSNADAYSTSPHSHSGHNSDEEAKQTGKKSSSPKRY